MKSILMSVFFIAGLAVAGCVPIQPVTSGAAPMSAQANEKLIADTIAREKGTWDDLRAHGVEETKSYISEDFVMIHADGSRGNREELLGIVGDPTLEFDEPVFGSMDAIVISPDAVMVIYMLDAQGAQDGNTFSFHEMTSSLWQQRDGVWMNTFLQSSSQ